MVAAVNGWQPPKRTPWSLFGQCEAAGLELPRELGIERGQCWRFAVARLVVCTEKGCTFCAHEKRSGGRVLNVTVDEIRNGIALDRVAGVLWGEKPKGGLF